MALDNYADFQAAIADQLARSDLTSQIVDCTTLFEADANSELFRIRLAEKTAILVPSSPGSLVVTSTGNNGSGLIRVATSSGTSSLVTGQEVSIGGVTGTTEANGSWIITVIDAGNIDLQGSTFVNAYAGGGLIQAEQGIAALPSDYMGWRVVTWTGNPNAVLEYVPPEIYLTEYPNSSTPGLTQDRPKIFTIENNLLKIMPVDPTPLELDYYAKNTALSASLNWLFTNRVDCYWAGVLEECYKYLKDYEQASVWHAQKGAIYQEIKTKQFRENNNMRIRPQGFSYGATP